jgi:hypothetical protein
MGADTSFAKVLRIVLYSIRPCDGLDGLGSESIKSMSPAFPRCKIKERLRGVLTLE